jgi:hypothetical protein
MTPKSVQIAADIDADLLPAVNRAEDMLERILGRSAGRVEVTWKRGQMGGDEDRSVQIALTDSGVTKEYDFLEWEFDEDIQIRRRLREVWDDVLADRIRILQDQSVTGSGDETGGD